jgi:serine/threonine protein phosphatase 1
MGHATLGHKNGPIVVVGDVHGCASELLTLLEQLALTPATTLLFVGDFIDRGPHSRQVIDLVLEVSERCHVVALLGNHEAMLLDFLDDIDSDAAGLFIFNGGAATLASYADQMQNYRLPAEHEVFLRSLRPWHETEDYFFVHAGVPSLPLTELDPELHRLELLWSRKFTRRQYDWSKVIVHGHTRVPEVELLPHRINVDTGCVYDNKLSAVELPSRRVISVPRLEKARPTVLTDGSKRRARRFIGALEVWIHRGEERVAFETVNYSPVGMLIRLKGSCDRPPLSQGEVVFGTIGAEALGAVTFRGRVVRMHSSDDGLYYGVAITHHE